MFTKQLGQRKWNQQDRHDFKTDWGDTNIKNMRVWCVKTGPGRKDAGDIQTGTRMQGP